MGREVDLEEHNNEFSPVDSGHSPKLSSFLHHLGNSHLPLWSLASHSWWREPLGSVLGVGCVWNFSGPIHTRQHDSMVVGPRLPRYKWLCWDPPKGESCDKDQEDYEIGYTIITSVLWAFWSRGKTVSGQESKTPLFLFEVWSILICTTLLGGRTTLKGLCLGLPLFHLSPTSRFSSNLMFLLCLLGTFPRNSS